MLSIREKMRKRKKDSQHQPEAKKLKNLNKTRQASFPLSFDFSLIHASNT
jgi:hypothetical protein